MQILKRLHQRIQSAFGLGHIKVVSDAGAQQIVQLTVGAGGPLQEVIDQLIRMGHYGTAYCPPDGSEALAVFFGGQRSNGVIIATGDQATRLKGLLAGESALYNGVTGAIGKMAADGKFHLNCDVVIDGSLTATKDITDHVSDGKGASMEAMRQTFDGHTHPSGTPNTGVPNQQMPD